MQADSEACIVHLRNAWDVHLSFIPARDTSQKPHLQQQLPRPGVEGVQVLQQNDQRSVQPNEAGQDLQQRAERGLLRAKMENKTSTIRNRRLGCTTSGPCSQMKRGRTCSSAPSEYFCEPKGGQTAYAIKAKSHSRKAESWLEGWTGARNERRTEGQQTEITLTTDRWP